MFTIFTFLSRSRKNQFLGVLQDKKAKRIYQSTISDEGISEAYLNRILNKLLNKKNKIKNSSMSLFGVKK
jgi:hypothetical protein